MGRGASRRDWPMAARAACRAGGTGKAASLAGVDPRPPRDDPFSRVQATAVCGVFGHDRGHHRREREGPRTLRIRAYEKSTCTPAVTPATFPAPRPIPHEADLFFDRGRAAFSARRRSAKRAWQRRIDAIAVTIQMGGTVYDLE